MTTGRALAASALVATAGSLSLRSAIPAPARPPMAIAVVAAAIFMRLGVSMLHMLERDAKSPLRGA
jgi:hypothetical protein